MEAVVVKSALHLWLSLQITHMATSKYMGKTLFKWGQIKQNDYGIIDHCYCETHFSKVFINLYLHQFIRKQETIVSYFGIMILNTFMGEEKPMLCDI